MSKDFDIINTKNIGGVSIDMRVPVKVINNSILDLPSYSTEHSDAVDLKAAFDCFEFDDEGIDPEIEGNGMYLITKKYVKEGVLIVSGQNIEISLYPGGRILIPTGLKVAIPIGWRLHIYGRSGIGLNYGMTISNGVGKIDSDYRGNVSVVLTNHGEKNFIIKFGDRIAQMSIEQSFKLSWNEVDKLDTTDRGEGGFGHTGNK